MRPNGFPDAYEDEECQSDCYDSDSETMAYDDNVDEPEFGLLFDIDGVIARGLTPIEPALDAMKYLKNGCNRLSVPVAFVTNGCSGPNSKKAESLSKWLNVEITADQVIQAPTPVSVLTTYHDKHVLVVGQDSRKEIAEDLGFHNLCFIEDIQECYPLLDMVDHDNRKRVAKGYTEKTFPQVEAILLLGEPKKWEGHLQLLMDLLLTEGLPTHAPSDPTNVPQLPIIACNMDLQFMAEACMPRFGHGAFLLCLEALYKKITGKDLEYTVLCGKPCELTYRFAEHTIYKIARNMGFRKQVKRLYFFGDNHQVDVVGANLYDRHLRKLAKNNKNNSHMTTSCNAMSHLPCSRQLPTSTVFEEQTVERCFSILVCTGVYKAGMSLGECDNSTFHGHRDIENDPSLEKPTKIVKDVFEGVRLVFALENVQTTLQLPADNMMSIEIPSPV